MAQLFNLKFFLYLCWLGVGSSPQFSSRETLYASYLAKDVLLKNKSKMNNEKTIEEINTEMQALWNEVDEKTNSILEVLKGVSYKNIRLIKASVERKVEEAINHSKLVL